eukprot:Gb_01524 [translate_table: standard]
MVAQEGRGWRKWQHGRAHDNGGGGLEEMVAWEDTGGGGNGNTGGFVAITCHWQGIGTAVTYAPAHSTVPEALRHGGMKNYEETVVMLAGWGLQNPRLKKGKWKASLVPTLLQRADPTPESQWEMVEKKRIQIQVQLPSLEQSLLQDKSSNEFHPLREWNGVTMELSDPHFQWPELHHTSV